MGSIFFRRYSSRSLESISPSLARWLSWLEHHPVYQKIGGFTPGQGTHLGCKSDCWSGRYGKQPVDVSLSHWCLSVFLSLSPCLSLPLSFPSSLSEMNKHILWERLKQKGSETVGRNGRLSICVWSAGVNTPSLIHEGVEHSGEGDKTRGANGLGLGL